MKTKTVITGYVIYPNPKLSGGFGKIAFEVETSSKEFAYRQMKEQYPNGTVHIVGRQKKRK